jgi:hypothetical protein
MERISPLILAPGASPLRALRWFGTVVHSPGDFAAGLTVAVAAKP